MCRLGNQPLRDQERIHQYKHIMKENLIILIFLAVATTSVAQIPQPMDYTAILRDSADAKVTDQSVALRLSFVTDTAGGQVVFQESHTASTDAAGLVSLQVGSGMAVSGSLDSVRWDTVAHYLRTEVDLNGGTDYTVTGYTRLLSVPYAYHTTLASVVDTVGYADDIEVRISARDDTLFFGTDGQFVVIPGLSPPSLRDGYVHCDPDNPMVIKTVMNPTTEKVWLDRNLGASRVATASNDSLAYGDLYQWGRFADGHQCRDSDTTSTNATTSVPNAGNVWDGKFILSYDDWLPAYNNDLWQGVDGANNPCPTGFRLPTKAEWEAELDSWSSEDPAGAYASSLKLVTTGDRTGDTGEIGVQSSVYTYGHYWSSSINGGDGSGLRIFSNTIQQFYNAFTNNSTRAAGFSVRCIKD